VTSAPEVTVEVAAVESPAPAAVETAAEQKAEE
jgi:hypothetical protein